MKKGFMAAAAVFLVASCGKSDDPEASAARNLVVEVGASSGLVSLTEAKDKDKSQDEEDEGDVKEQEIQQCRDVFSETALGFKVAGSENQISMEPTQAFAVKITGNQNVLNLTIKAKEGETAPVSFPGLCLVLGGHQPIVRATLLGVSLEHLKIVGHGNEGRVEITLQEGAAIPEGSADDLGKHVTVTISDAATAP